MGAWVEHELGSVLGEEDVLLCGQGDSSSATDWLAKSSFGDECPLHLAISRSMAGYLNRNLIAHYSQWLPGKENSVADVLSRDFHLDDSAVVSLLRENFSHQMPQSFCLVRSTAMISGVRASLRLLPRTQPLPLTPVPSAAAAGISTLDSSPPSAITTTPSWSTSARRNDSKSSLVSQQPFVKGGNATPSELWELALDARRVQFVQPSTAWHRPFEETN